MNRGSARRLVLSSDCAEIVRRRHEEQLSVSQSMQQLREFILISNETNVLVFSVDPSRSTGVEPARPKCAAFSVYSEQVSTRSSRTFHFLHFWPVL